MFIKNVKYYGNTLFICVTYKVIYLNTVQMIYLFPWRVVQHSIIFTLPFSLNSPQDDLLFLIWNIFQQSFDFFLMNFPSNFPPSNLNTKIKRKYNAVQISCIGYCLKELCYCVIIIVWTISPYTWKSHKTTMRYLEGIKIGVKVYCKQSLKCPIQLGDL